MDKNLTEQYHNIDWEGLLRKDSGKSGSLERTKIHFDRIKKVLDRFVNLPYYEFNDLPLPIQNSATEQLTGFLKFIDESIKSYSDLSQRNTMIIEIRNQEYTIIKALTEFDSYLRTVGFYDNDDELLQQKHGQLDKELQNLEKELKETQAIRSDFDKELQKTKEIRSDFAKRVQGYGAGDFGKHFEKQADIHKENAFIYFELLVATILTIIFLSSLFFFEIWIFQLPEVTIKEGHSFGASLFQFLSDSKVSFLLIIFSMFVYATRYFSKNYFAEKNLQNVYTQKQKALDAHKQILDAVQDTGSGSNLETQNALLVYMSQSIFEVHPSGYLDKKDRSPNPRISPLNLTRTDYPRW